MKPLEIVEYFLKTQRIATTTKSRKRNILVQFIEFIELTEELPEGDWRFEESEKVVDEDDNLIGRCPITSAPFANFMSEISRKYEDKKSRDQRPRDRSYNDVIYTLKQFGAFLADENILIENPAAELETRIEKQTDMGMQRLSRNEVTKLLTAAYNFDEHRVRNFTLVLMLLSTAVRIGEAVKLTVSNYIQEKNIIYCDGKSNQRTRFATPGLNDCVTRLCKESARTKALVGSADFLFYSSNGGPLTTCEANKILKDLALRAGITRDISTYWLRRSFATFLAESGLSIRTIQFLFDHDDVNNTERYIPEYILFDLRNVLDDSVINQLLINNARSNLRLVKKA